MALCFIEAALWPMNVLYCGNTHLCSCDLDLGVMAFIYKLDNENQQQVVMQEAADTVEHKQVYTTKHNRLSTVFRLYVYLYSRLTKTTCYSKM